MFTKNDKEGEGITTERLYYKPHQQQQVYIQFPGSTDELCEETGKISVSIHRERQY